MNRRLWFIGIMVLAAVALTTTGCASSSASEDEPPRQVTVVYAFSTEEEVLTKDILPVFQAYWQQHSGGKLIFTSVFTGSEEIANAILDGAPADVAILSNEQHATWLHINDRVKTDWHTFPNEGVVSRSPMVIVVRPGNPLDIADWADLTRPDVKLIHPDPRTSGGAQWALLAEYGAAILSGGDAEAASRQVKDLWENVISTPPSTREAMKEFLFGVGDALITYEQDALLAKSRGATIEVIVPPTTIMSEHVVVMVDSNVDPWEQDGVRSFINFLWSDTAQKAFTRYYFRAVTDEALNQAVPEFGPIQRPFTVNDLGGWGRAYPEIIHAIWEEQIAR
jgi:sulfate transport system substrate-binding protein